MNKSGLIPVEYKCVVRPHQVEETDELLKRAKSAGIEIVNDNLEREQLAQVKAELIAVGGVAFEGWGDLVPKPGDTVLISKYAGYMNEGLDGEEYRLINDKDIVAIVEQSNE